MATIDAEELIESPNAALPSLIASYLANVSFWPVDTGSFAPTAEEVGLGKTEAEDGSIAPQYIRGKVLDYDGLPVSRVVIAVDRATGSRLAITTSDGSGWFTLRPRTLDPVVLVAVPLNDEQINAVVLDNILPVPI